jgi:hypothetical protein
VLIALVGLLHVLVFVYWLGGDLGAFYLSRVIGDPARPTAVRIAAAQAMGDLDMAPRTSLILALPTGLTLASMSGHLPLPAAVLSAFWAGSLAWLWLAWRIHLKHLPSADPGRRLDLLLRWVVLATIAGVGAAVVAGGLDWPLFLGLKLLILAAAVACGLWVRALLAPFGPAFGELAASGPTPEGDRIIAQTFARVRPVVLTIWALITAAALLGLWRPL